MGPKLIPVSLDDGASPELVVIRPDVGPDSVRIAAAVLSRTERQRAGWFALDRDRDRFIVIRARLRQFLSAWIGARPESLEIVCGPYGKPALAPGSAKVDLRFNVSHRDGLAAFAFSVGGEVGIDVEAVRPSADDEQVAARFFSHAERAAHLELAPQDRPLGFFQCWTRKEAFVKAVGDGLTHPLDGFDVSLGRAEPTILRVGNVPGDRCGWRLRSFVPALGYVGAFVVEERS